MEHDLNAFMIQSYLKHSAGTLTSPVSVDTVVPSQVMHSVQASFVLVKTLQPNFVSENCQELVQVVAVLIVVQDLLLGVLTLLHIDDAHLQLRLDEHLVR